MSADIDQEVEAIKVVLKALEPLDQKVRQSVLEYVVRRLEIPPAPMQPARQTVKDQLSPDSAPPTAPVSSAPIHLSKLVQEEKPKSAIEMATLVAYYLSHVAPESERKTTVTGKDIETYFKIGGSNYLLSLNSRFRIRKPPDTWTLQGKGNTS